MIHHLAVFRGIIQKPAHCETGKVLIRILTADDASAYWQLRLEALEREPRAFASSVDVHLKMSIEATAARLDPKPDGNFVVGAFSDDRTLIGVAGFYREERLKMRHKGAIWGVYVMGPWRQKGVAGQLLSAIIDRLRTYSDLDHVVLHVTADQTAARRLYESFGFENTGIERRAFKVDGQFLDQLQMVLWLPASAADTGSSSE